MEVRIEKVSPMRVAYIRHMGPSDTCCETWGRLYEWAGRHKLVGPGTLGIGAWHDSPDSAAPDHTRYDACLTCSKVLDPDDDEVKIQVLGGGEYAVAIHRGAIRGMKDALCRMMKEWVPQSGRKVRDAPCLEIYLDDPERTPADDVRTKICVPLEPES